MREQHAGTVETVAIKAERLEIRPGPQGTTEILLDGVPIPHVASITLSCDWRKGRMWNVTFETVSF